jgi:hypothetical protein
VTARSESCLSQAATGACDGGDGRPETGRPSLSGIPTTVDVADATAYEIAVMTCWPKTAVRAAFEVVVVGPPPHKVNLASGIYEGIDPRCDRDGILERGGEDEWRLTYAPPEEHVVEPELARAERAIGPLPLALAALFRRVGQVFLYGSFDDWNPSAFLFEDGHDTRRGDLNSDALNFIGVGSVANYISNDGVVAPFYIRDDGQFHAQIALDHDHSRGYSGGCHVVRLPAPVADPVLEYVYDRPRTTLVEYLRTAFRWGGFPGLEFEASSFSGGSATQSGPAADLIRQVLRLDRTELPIWERPANRRWRPKSAFWPPAVTRRGCPRTPGESIGSRCRRTPNTRVLHIKPYHRRHDLPAPFVLQRVVGDASRLLHGRRWTPDVAPLQSGAP